MFSHEKLDVYKLSLQFVKWAYILSKKLKGSDRHAKDQLLRASLSIPLNIAEGNGKRPSPDRNRFIQIAYGSVFECAAILDVINVCEMLTETEIKTGKEMVDRIVAMLIGLLNRYPCLKEDMARYDTGEFE